MKKQEIVNLLNGLFKVGNIAGRKFGYAIARNVAILEPEIKKFNEAKEAIVKNYSKKDKKGNPLKDEKGFIIEDQEGADKEYRALLEEEVELKLFKINLEEVPENVTAEQQIGIYQIIKE